MIPPRSLRLCGEKGVPPLFRTLTVLPSPALNLPEGGPPPGSIPPLAGDVNLPRGERMGRAPCPPGRLPPMRSHKRR